MTVQIVNKTEVLELHIYHTNVFSINFRFKEIYTKMHYLEVLALTKKIEGTGNPHYSIIILQS